MLGREKQREVWSIIGVKVIVELLISLIVKL